jgi:hypothetical protein
MLYENSPSYHHPQEKDFCNVTVETETDRGTSTLDVYLLRLYPERYNGCDAYMDANSIPQDLITVRFLRKTWKVVSKPVEIPISGYFRGDMAQNNPPGDCVGLIEIDS